MDQKTGEDLFEITGRLDPILKTLTSIRKEIERTKPSILIDHYFGILVACRHINETKVILAKIAQGSKHKGTEKFQLFWTRKESNPRTSANPEKDTDDQ